MNARVSGTIGCLSRFSTLAGVILLWPGSIGFTSYLLLRCRSIVVGFGDPREAVNLFVVWCLLLDIVGGLSPRMGIVVVGSGVMSTVGLFPGVADSPEIFCCLYSGLKR